MSSSLAGIRGGTDCSAAYPRGTVVTLTATPASGPTFEGWTGGGRTGTGTCAVTVTDVTTVNCDFLQHYRPTQNVVRRPVAGGAGKGYALTGHHELLLPLLCAALVEGWEG